MTLITIREIVGAQAGAPNAEVSFDHGSPQPVTVKDPFGKGEEELLEWYFEQHLESPFLDREKASRAAASIHPYGETLFRQVFTGLARQDYTVARAAGTASLEFEIEGSPEFHSLHWEALKDPDLPHPFALECTFVRKSRQRSTLKARVRPSPTLNVLVVVARPRGRDDVGYRTISRPLVETIEKTDLPVRIDILRPGTYEELARRLDETRTPEGGLYHIVHFDVHGALMRYDQFNDGAIKNQFVYQDRFGREDVKPYEGQRAYLFLEGTGGKVSDPVEAGELAQLLSTQQVPVVVLNACQSGMEMDAPETGKPISGVSETSLANRLIAGGVQVAVGMSYSVTVSAAELLMKRLYQELFNGGELVDALRKGRWELSKQKSRRAYHNQMIDLEDWLLPVAYQNQPVRLVTRDFIPAEREQFYQSEAHTFPFPAPAYGFFGRDLDVLEIEKRVLAVDGGPRNLLLVRGMGGAGKTTLLRHLGAWWQRTNFVKEVFYFGYDEKAHTAQQILHEIAQCLLGEAEYYSQFTPLSPEAGEAFIAKKLRGERHLLILDNLESVTGEHLAIGNTLPPEERAKLRRFLARLAGGQTLVLLGSRGGESWLVDPRDGQPGPLRAEQIYELGGLDNESASNLADEILRRSNALQYRASADLKRLLRLLDGFPLALEVVLPNLKREAPAGVLEALEKGLAGIDTGKIRKTESILRCVEYSNANLSPDAQALLLCLAPFSGVLNTEWMPQYTQKLRAQPALEKLPFERWTEVLLEATEWGLLSPHPELKGYVRIQPVLPFFLRERLRQPGQEAVKEAIETAFRELYIEVGDALSNAMKSKEAQERQIGQVLAQVEYENLFAALNLTLYAKDLFSPLYIALSYYLDAVQDQSGGLQLAESILATKTMYSTQDLDGRAGLEFVVVLDDLAKRKFLLKRYAEAGIAYQDALTMLQNLKSLDSKDQALYCASVYHQLGVVAAAQRDWAQAEQYYKQALQIKIDFNDRYSQASTYHQLGRVAEEQQQWDAAREYYLQDLQISAEYKDPSIEITWRSLARLWQAGGDATLPAAAAGVMGATPEEVEELFKKLQGKEQK